MQLNILKNRIKRWVDISLATINRAPLESLLVKISLISVVTVIAAYAFFYKIHADFMAINGAYQTFNPIRRIMDGEIPDLDFTIYLGVGTTYLITFLAFLTGGNFSAVSFSNHFLHLFCHFLAFLSLFYLSGMPLRRSLFVASGIVAIIPLVIDDSHLSQFLTSLKIPFVPSLPLLPAWGELFTPGLSNLGLRSALPFLTSLCLLIAIHYLKNQPLGLFICWGSLIGVQPLWSNDYGLISSLVLFFIASLYILKYFNLIKGQLFFILITSAIVAFFSVASIATRGHPNFWIRNNLLGIANDQFWYYGLATSKVFSLSQILPDPFLYYYGILLCSFTLYICLTPANVRNMFLLYVALTTFGAGVISCIGSGISNRYFIPTFFVSYFVIGCLGLLLINQSIHLLLKIKPSTLNGFISMRSRLSVAFLKKVVAFLLIVFYVTFVVKALPRISPTPDAANYMYVKKLGGWLPNAFSRSIEIGNKIKQETQSLPPQRRILSTYASLIDTLADSKNVSGVDYIIHALGEDLRQQYRDRFQAAMPEYITTIREDYTAWETWVRRVNWWFYREFILQYRPVNATFYNIIWQRKQPSSPIPSVAIDCAISPQKANSVNLVFSSNLLNQADAATSSTYYVDVELNYALTVKSTGMPLIGSRGIVNATEVKVAIPKENPLGSSSYGMPPRHSHWHIPLIHRFGEPSVLNMTGYPEDRATLRVLSCNARPLVPESLFEMIQETTAKNFTDADWKNGIAMNGYNQPEFLSKAGFLFDDSAPQALLVPGMMVEFAQGGRRKILAIRERQVWVTGEALDPVMDGYPHAIKLRIK